MNDLDDITQACIYIALVIATFLLNTGRALKAIEICKECLFFVNTKALEKEKEFAIVFTIPIYRTIFKAYYLLPDYTNAIKYGRELLDICRECGEGAKEGELSITLAYIYERQSQYAEARELYEKAINIMIETGDREGQAYAYEKFGTMSYLLGEYDKAKGYLKKVLAIKIETRNRAGEATCYVSLGNVFQSLGEYDKAKEYYEKALEITVKIGDREGQAASYGHLGTVFHSLGVYEKAKEYLEKALAIRIEIGNREAADYANLGTVFQFLGEYKKAKEYNEKALKISVEIGDREGQAASYANLGAVFRFLGRYDKGKEYLEKALAIRIEIGDRAGQASDYRNLGTVFQSLVEYEKAKEYYEKALKISVEIGDRKGQAASYANLGTVFRFLGEYDKAKEYLEKALAIRIEIGDREGQASDYGHLGTVFLSLGDYDKAEEYLEKALAIRIEIGNREGQASDYGNLATVFRCLGEYDKAKQYVEKAMAIRIEIGSTEGQAADNDDLGTVFQCLGEYEKAKEYYERALLISSETGNRAEEANIYGRLGNVFTSLGEYDKAKEYLEKALAIRIEIGDRKGQATDYANLGTVFQSLGEYDKAKEYLQKALAMIIDIGDRAGEANLYGSLGTLFHSLGQYVLAERYLKKALSISQDIGSTAYELSCYQSLALVKLSLGEMQEAFDYLLLSVNKSEHLRGFLRDNDQFKTSFSDVHSFPYQFLAVSLCFSRNPNNALYVLELARARALADLMATQYNVEMQISANPQSWIGIENVMKKESNCTCLYISYFGDHVFLWILKNSGVIHFRRITVNENIVGAKLVSSLDNFFAGSFRNLGVLPQLDCEDRSLNNSVSETKFSQEENLADLRLVEDDDDDNQEPKPSLPLLYKIIIAPVADLVEEPEIIIVPDRALYQVPFAALSDMSGKYLSEAFRIRIVPSLSTLKLIQDSPADYHSQTGALIVGDPVVGRVRYKGRRTNFSPLPCARKEAEMIGKLVPCVQPLLGQHATKEAVLKSLHSVSLIHFAAHGDAEKGEIALSPLRSTKSIPDEEDYLLTMSDISKVQLRAKLVVLSCCHSGCGQIRAEGVIGIARAFLGSGARSVLVALWALEDRATEQLMRHFYEHLVRGESASESLHKTMKWMRGNGFTEVSKWASFMLIGDNVTFDFGK